MLRVEPFQSMTLLLPLLLACGRPPMVDSGALAPPDLATDTAAMDTSEETAHPVDSAADTAIGSSDTAEVLIPCVSTLRPESTLKLCGAHDRSYAGDDGLDVVLDADGELRVLIGTLNDESVYVVDASVGPGALQLVEGPGIDVLHGHSYDAAYGVRIDARETDEATLISVGAPLANWFDASVGRVYIYDLADAGEEEPTPIGMVNGDWPYVYMGQNALLPGQEGGETGIVLGRHQWGGYAGYPTAWVFWSTRGLDALTSDADLVVAVDEYVTLVGEDLAGADMDGDGADDALLSAAHGVVVAPAGLLGFVDPSELDGASVPGFDGASFAVNDLDGDGYRDVALFYAPGGDGPPCNGAIIPGPLGSNPTLNEAIGGFSLYYTTGGCNYTVATSDLGGSEDMNLVVGTGTRALIHRGGVVGWLDETAFTELVDSKVGQGFGEQMAITDVDSDGEDELIVSAPYQGDYDEGAVYIFWDP